MMNLTLCYCKVSVGCSQWIDWLDPYVGGVSGWGGGRLHGDLWTVGGRSESHESSVQTGQYEL